MNKTTRPYSRVDLLVWHLVSRGSARPPPLLLCRSQAGPRPARSVVKGSTRRFVDCNTHIHAHIHSHRISHCCVQTCSLKFPQLNLSHALSFLFHELPRERSPINNNQLSEAFMQTTTGCRVYLSCRSNFWLKLGQVMPHWWIPAGHSDVFLVFK